MLVCLFEQPGSSGGAGGGAGAGAGAAAAAAQPFRLKKAIKSALKEVHSVCALHSGALSPPFVDLCLDLSFCGYWQAPDSSMKLKKLRKLVHALPGASAITDFKATFMAQVRDVACVCGSV